MTIVAESWGVGQVLFSIIWVVLFFIWIMLLLSVFGDIFRSHDLSGGAKAIWIIFVIFLPYLGVFAYLIIRGRHMTEHALADAQQNEQAARAYIRDAAGTSPADELSKLAALRQQGAIDDAEFQKLKAKIVS